MLKDFYTSFEDKFRGSRELIKKRLEVYLPFITPLPFEQIAGAGVLDLGCGRGEWIELLGEQGIDAIGVDINESMLANAEELGLDLRCTDLFSFIEALPNNSLLAVTSFHVVEHIAFDDLRSLVDEILRVLVPGGVLIFETPNPENLMVASWGFYMDPTHKSPIPPALMSFTIDFHGFERSKVMRLQEAEGLKDQEEISLTSVVAGVSPDYAVIAQKKADSEVMSLIDAPFNENFGVTFEHLSDIYDRRLIRFDQQLRELSSGLTSGQGRIDELNVLAFEGKTNFDDELANTATRFLQLEERLESFFLTLNQYEKDIDKFNSIVNEQDIAISRVAQEVNDLESKLSHRIGVSESVLVEFSQSKSMIWRIKNKGRILLGRSIRSSNFKKRLYGYLKTQLISRPRLLRFGIVSLQKLGLYGYFKSHFFNSDIVRPSVVRLEALAPRAKDIRDSIAKQVEEI